ncbi:MAG: hypothetical protein V4638_00585 [Bacteroidota bacterium]
MANSNNKKNRNKIDLFIEKLGSEFSKIPNFNLTQEDPDGKELFNFIVSKFADLSDFKILYKQYFIPATNRARAATIHEIKSSHYLKILDIPKIDLEENYYDTIRLGYVGLFHKVENFVKDLLILVNKVFNNGKKGKDSIESFVESRYGFKFNNWHGDLYMKKINWIANCVKHYDGYPLKLPKYEYLTYLPEDQKIKIKQEDFFNDIEYVLNSYYQMKLSQMLALATFKMVFDEIEPEDLNGDLLVKLNDADTQMKKLVELDN